MARLLAITVASTLLAVSATAAAEEARLARARRYLDQQAYAEARHAFKRALREGGLGPQEVREVYRGLAKSAAALRHPEEARDAYVRLLLLEPDHYVPSDASPLIREPFVLAQDILREHGDPSLDWSPPDRIAPGEPFEIALELPDEVAPTLVQRVEATVSFEPGGESETMTLTGGHATIDAARLASAERVLVWFELFDEFGNQVAAIGSAEEPLIVPLEEPPPADEPDAPEPQRRRWYQRWWFWTIVGAVVVGAAVGIPVGVSARQGSDPCEENLGGPCDLHLRF